MKYLIKKHKLTLFICLIFISLAHSQDKNPTRFETTINTIDKLHFDKSIDRIVFTGSSSIRMWVDLQSYYPNHQIINTGFGGSQMSDLHFYLEETVIKFKPSKVFIYEGDNDISNGVSIKKIISQTKKVINHIQKSLPGCEIILISPKPSIARWNLNSKYISLNKRLSKITRKYNNTFFINVWSVMLNSNGELKDNLFIEDGLHMNAKGYGLWNILIKPYLK